MQISPSLVISHRTSMQGSGMQAALGVGWKLVLGPVQALVGGLEGRGGDSGKRQLDTHSLCVTLTCVD